MRVMLINPPLTLYEGSDRFGLFIPIGLLHVAAVVREVADVKVLDCAMQDFSVVHGNGWAQYGAGPQSITKSLREYVPRIVGISVLSTSQFDDARRIAEMCKHVDPTVCVVMGGADVSVRFREVLEEGICDYCIVGEGEAAFREFVLRVERGQNVATIPGVAHRIPSGVELTTPVFQRNLDQLPLPAYDLVDLSAYLRNPLLYANRTPWGRNSVAMVTSRGCPYHCTFCSIHAHMGWAFRAHSPEYVIRHIRLLVSKYGVRHIHFEDDNIAQDAERFDKLLGLLADLRPRVAWDTPNGVRADTVSARIATRMKLAGCTQVTVAIESGVDRVLRDVIHKGERLDTSLSAVSEVRRAGLPCKAFYVVGFPDESEGEMEATLSLALRLLSRSDVLPVVMVATPLPGTSLLVACQKRGVLPKQLSPSDYAVGTHIGGRALIAENGRSPEQMANMLQRYRNRMRLWRILSAVRQPRYTLRLIAQRVRASVALRRARVTTPTTS